MRIKQTASLLNTRPNRRKAKKYNPYKRHLAYLKWKKSHKKA